MGLRMSIKDQIRKKDGVVFQNYTSQRWNLADPCKYQISPDCFPPKNENQRKNEKTTLNLEKTKRKPHKVIGRDFALDSVCVSRQGLRYSIIVDACMHVCMYIHMYICNGEYDARPWAYCMP